MEIISQHTKKIMEKCKERARDAGLLFDSESLEYIVTNRDMLELTPKGMIPTLYDYWVNDLELIKGIKEYELYPHNAYETVINSRPALSFYNDNNPDWLNVMIFYHVLAHIDFMQNNSYFRKTWEDDFVGQALADKRLISNYRSKYGRWVDYVIEFTRSIDNITGYYKELSELDKTKPEQITRIDYFFNIFLQQVKKVSSPLYLKEIDNYNRIITENETNNKKQAESLFISNVKAQYPEFETLYKKHIKETKVKPFDLIKYLIENSTFLNEDENKWMKSVMEIVRNTALHFEPQRRTKIINEGWSTYWHNELFISDNRIKGHEADFAKINAFVTAVPMVGFNPYAVGFRLFEFINESSKKGKLCYDFEKLKDIEKRKSYNHKTGNNKDYLFYVRSNFCDFTFINSFVNQDFTDRYNLVVVGDRINKQRMTREYYIKSKKHEDYKSLIINHLIHPPHITISKDQTKQGILYLIHHFEGKQLIREFIDNTMIGLEYLWGKEVKLETQKIKKGKLVQVIYTAKNKKITETEAG
jgi:stage V sporulation protein R